MIHKQNLILEFSSSSSSSSSQYRLFKVEMVLCWEWLHDDKFIFKLPCVFRYVGRDIWMEGERADGGKIPYRVYYVTIVITVQCPADSIHVETAGNWLKFSTYRETWNDALVSEIMNKRFKSLTGQLLFHNQSC